MFDQAGAAGRLSAGIPIAAPQPIFPRYVDPEAEQAVAG